MNRKTLASVDRFWGARGTGVVSEMRTKALRLDISQSWIAPCALLLLLDCGIARGPKPEVDSESHFLGCTSETDCGGVAGATCAGGWCVDVETGERVGTNALGDGNWDALPPGSSAEEDFPDGPRLEGAPTAAGVPLTIERTEEPLNYFRSSPTPDESDHVCHNRRHRQGRRRTRPYVARRSPDGARYRPRRAER